MSDLLDREAEGRVLHVVTYPVDNSLTPDEAWDEIRLYGRRLTWTGGESWANAKCVDVCECGPDGLVTA